MPTPSSSTKSTAALAADFGGVCAIPTTASMSAIPTGSFAPDSPSRIVPERPRTSLRPSTENITAGSVGATAAPSNAAVFQSKPSTQCAASSIRPAVANVPSSPSDTIGTAETPKRRQPTRRPPSKRMKTSATTAMRSTSWIERRCATPGNAFARPAAPIRKIAGVGIGKTSVNLFESRATAKTPETTSTIAPKCVTSCIRGTVMKRLLLHRPNEGAKRVGPQQELVFFDVPATVIVGAQWGDEGKGKIVDLLAQESDVVCRYQGGPNAGHTIIVDAETFKIRQVPSGVVSGKLSIIGAGCVVDPEVLLGELDQLAERGLEPKVVVSGKAHVIMPWHVAIDQASERRLGKLKIGTTRRGIGPAYADKASRIGIRVQDVLDAKILRQKIEVALAEKNIWLERVYEVEPFDLEEVAARYESYAQRLRPYVGDTSLIVDRALRDGRDVLFEGGQGTLLDLDHGTYPFVTSSATVAANAATGIGLGPNRIDHVVGVAKAYVTRVGEGPFPTEIEGDDQERVRELGGEYGTVTGRQRRCGWLDLVALRYAVRLNGITSLALTKLDVLSAFAELPVCVRYRLRDGAETPDFPAHQSDFHAAQPVYETLPGWEEPLGSELPEAARRYVELVERELDVEVTL